MINHRQKPQNNAMTTNNSSDKLRVKVFRLHLHVLGYLWKQVYSPLPYEKINPFTLLYAQKRPGKAVKKYVKQIDSKPEIKMLNLSFPYSHEVSEAGVFWNLHFGQSSQK